MGCCACFMSGQAWGQEQAKVNVLKMLERSTMTPATMCFILDSRQSIVNDTQNLMQFVQVSPEPQNGISSSIEQNTLCVSGLNPGEHYTLQLKQGLKLTSGKSLAQDVTVPFAISDAQSQIKLPYNMILPKNNKNEAFAIETLNQSAFKLNVYRLSTRSINNLDLYNLLDSNISNYTLVSLLTQNARLIYSKTFDLSSGQAREVTFLSDGGNFDRDEETKQKLELAKPLPANLRNQPIKTEIKLGEFVDEDDDGIYLVLACDPRVDTEQPYNLYEYNLGSLALNAKLLMFTDIGLTTYKSSDGILANVRSLTSGRNMSGVKIELIAANNEVLASNFTNDNGTVKFGKTVVSGDNALRPVALVASTSKDVYSLDLRSVPLYIEGNQGIINDNDDFETFAYTDRGIYRPGETVHYTALVRDGQLEAFDGPLVLSILNHQGSEIERVLLNDSKSGGYEYDFKIPQGSALGNYNAVLSLGKQTLKTTGFTVGSMVPLQINTEILNEDSIININEPYTLKSHASFNYGSNAANLQGAYEITRYPDLKPITTTNAALSETLSDFHFGIDAREQSKLTKTDQIYDLRTDVEGMLQHQVTFKPETYPQKITVVSKVFDTSNQEVRAAKNFKLAYNRPLIGIKQLPQDDQTAFALCSYLQDGSTFPQDVKYYLYKEFTDYNFVLENNTWQYLTFKSKKLVNQGQVKIDNLDLTKPLISFPLEDGNYILELKSDKSETTLAFNQGFMSSSEATTPDRIDVFADKSVYKVGDTAVLSFDSPFNGFANLVIGRQGVDVFKTFNVKRGHNEIKVNIDELQYPQAHALLSLYAPMTTPAPQVIRVVGTVDLNLDLSAHKLNVTADIPSEIKPEGTVTVKLQATPSDESEKLKQPYAKLTLVDNGILQLTNFKSPDPNAELAQDRAFNLQMYDAYGYIMRDPMQQGQGYGGTSEKLFAMMNDSAVTTLFDSPIKATALASKIVPLDEKGQASVDFELPQFSGSLKVMAVAWDKNKTGATNQDLIVRDNAVASLGLPRFLNSGDEAMVRLNLHNLKSTDPNFNLDLYCSGALQCSQQTQVNLKPGARSDLYFKVKGLEQGTGTVSLKVMNGEFNHSQDYTLSVTSPQLPTINTQSYFLEPKASITLDLNQNFENILGVMVNTSVLPNVNPDILVRQIDSSNWSLQDIASSLESKLYYGTKLLEDYKVKDGQENSVTYKALGGDIVMYQAKFRSEPELNDAIQELVERISVHINGSDSLTDFDLIYATEVLLQAHDQGFMVNLSTIDRALNQIRKMSDNFNSYGIGSYASAVLSKIESVNPANLRYALDESKLIQPLQLAYLARALYQIGDSNRAEIALDRAITNILAWQQLEQKYEITQDAETLDELQEQIKKFRYSSTSLTHDAYVLIDTCMQLGKVDRGLDLINKLTSLQEQHYFLDALTMSAMLRANYHLDKSQVQVATNEQTVIATTEQMEQGEQNKQNEQSTKQASVKSTVEANEASSEATGAQATTDNFNETTQFFDAEQAKTPLTLTNDLDKPFFKTVSVLGKLKHDKIMNNGINVRINYFNKSARIDPESYQFRLNEEVLMEVNVQQTQGYASDSLLRVKLPAGFEFVRTAASNDPSFGQLLNNVRTDYTKVETGDDMAVAKFSQYQSNKNRSVFMVLRAALPGTYAQGEALVQMQQLPHVFGTYHNDATLKIQSDKSE